MTQLEMLFAAVRKESGKTIADLQRADRQSEVVEIRRACMWIMTEVMTPRMNVTETAAFFERDHATCTHARTKHLDLIGTGDKRYTGIYERLRCAFEAELKSHEDDPLRQIRERLLQNAAALRKQADEMEGDARKLAG